MTTRPSKGFSLLELMIAIAVVGIITSIAVPYFGDQVHKARVAQAVADILKIAQALEVHYMENDVYPDSLNAIDGPDISLTDPWDRAYRYLNIGSQKGNGVYRKNGALVPINTGFDLYSVGEDGSSVSAITAAPSQDDVIWANDGNFVGLAEDY